MEAGWYLQESQSGTLHPLNKRFITLGRTSADIKLTSKSVERRHAVLGFDLRDGVYKIKDFNTTYGTYVNNRKISSDGSFVPLKTDDLLRFGQDATSYQLVKMNSQDSLNGPDGSNRSENTGGLSGGGIGPAAVPPRNPSELDGIETQSGPEMSGNQFEAVRLLTQHPVNSDLYSRGANAGRVEMAVDTDLPGHSSPEFLRKQPEPLVRPTSAPNPSGFPGGFYVAQTAQPGCPPPPYTTDNNLTSGQPHLVYQPVVNSGPGPAAFMFPGGGVYYAAANQSPSVMGAYIAYNTQHLPYHLGEFPQQFCSPTHQRHMGIPPTANTGCPACSHTHNGCQLAMANPNVMTNYQAVEVVADSIPTEQFRSNSFGTVRSPKAERRQQISNAERDCPVTRLNESITKKMTANHDRTTDDFHTTSESNDFTRPHQKLLEIDNSRTPLFGQSPAWWGDPQPSAGSSSTSPRSSRKDYSETTEEMLVSSEKPHKPRFTMMEIPFRDDPKPVKPVEQTAKQHEATAFTIEFNSDESTKIISLKKSPPDPHEKSIKKYEPKANAKPKRSSGYTSDNPIQHHVKEPRAGTASEREDLRSKTSTKSSKTSANQMGNVKEYLLKKLLLNSSNNNSSDSGSQTSPTTSDQQSPTNQSELANSSLLSVPLMKKDNSDNISDAGTYVIENEDEVLQIEGDFEELAARQAIDKVFGISPQSPLSPDLPDSTEESKTPSPQLKATDEPVITPRRSYAIQENRVDHSTFTIETLSLEKLAFIDADGKLSNSSSPKHNKAEPSQNFSIDAKPKKKPSTFSRTSLIANKQPIVEEKPKNEEYEEESDKRGLVKQLLKITKEQQKEELRSKVPQKPPQSELTTKKSTRLSEAEINFERGGSVRLRESPVVSQLKTSATPGNFARSDGGRFSMKSVGPTRPTSNQPGSRASLAGPAVSAKNHPAPAHKPKENPELAAWLRRKGYNPLKAAAEGHKKKMSLPKESLTDISCAEESPQYLSNRSMSYHAGSPQIAQGGFSQPQRKLSSQDCSIAENELSTRSDSFVVASLSRNIANDISNLTSEAFSDAEPQVNRKKILTNSISSPQINVQSESIEALNNITRGINKCAREALGKIKEESLSASMEDLITRLDYRIEANEASSDEDISSILGHLVVVKETYEAVNKFLTLRCSPKTSSRTHSSGEDNCGEVQKSTDPNDLRLKATLSKMRNYWSARRPSVDSNDSNV